jgi:hypothetical protein
MGSKKHMADMDLPANKVDGATASNAIAMSIGKKSDKKKKKTTKEKK